MCHQLWSKFRIESKPISMSIILAVAFCSTFTFVWAAYMSLLEAGFTYLTNASLRLHWSKNNPGYHYHVVSTALEWVTINASAAFVFCLSRRMKQFQAWQQVFKWWLHFIHFVVWQNMDLSIRYWYAQVNKWSTSVVACVPLGKASNVLFSFTSKSLLPNCCVCLPF